MYHDGSRVLQDPFDTRRMADRIAERLVHDRFTGGDRTFIEGLDMFFLATADADGRPTCSYKGGDPGFVRVVDDRTLAFPSYDGNGMFLSFGNLMRNPHVGLLFIDFVHGWRTRVDGTAQVVEDDPLVGLWPGAQFVVRVTARAIYPNCPRYIHRMQPVERSPYVPREGCSTPVPEWKRSDWARDVLPEHDPARDHPVP
jgi:predicted pyridoxine 5'-phosphate oxidase superfamily flavin-nucleotide-binding protein